MAVLDMDQYRKFTQRAEIDKAINMLRGIVAGINSSGDVSDAEMNELVGWCQHQAELRNMHPFSQLLPKIEAAIADGVLDEEEREDILWFCSTFTGEGEYFHLATAKMQFLHGLIHGIMADGDLSDTEIRALQDWIVDQEDLKGIYPFDEIDSLLTQILADGVVTNDERNTLMAFLSNFIEYHNSENLSEADYEELRKKFSVSGICAVDPEITFEGRQFCFTGESEFATRNELIAKVESLGGTFKPGVSKKTDYLVIGGAGNPCWAFSCYGRKVEQAVKLRKEGARVQIVKEADFWDAVRDITGE